MGCGSSKVSCPKCKTFKTKDGAAFLHHINHTHTIKCTKCQLYGFQNKQELEEHNKNVHEVIENNNNNNNIKNNGDNIAYERDNESLVESVEETVDSPVITCPKCGSDDFTDGEDFMEHLQNVHSFQSTTNIRAASNPQVLSDDGGNKKLPKIGDRVLAMWSESLWQYFHATIKKFFKNNLTYEIDWDDGDTTGRIVNYYNIAIDRIPDPNEIGIGSIMLFSQGQYNAGSTQLYGGVRWHQGCITKIYTRNKKTFYDGHHTKGKSDGKFCTYRGYSYDFQGKELSEFRVGPNIFDILGDDESSVNNEDIDIYFSYTSNDLPAKLKEKLPANDNNQLVDLLTNPESIEEDLKIKGLNVVNSTNNKDLKQKVNLMKNSKVFIACISDEYVLNEQCRMEFQYAKATLKKPVVPLVIGNGMDWMMSVVGMLIAGELYIHFKDKTVHSEKCQEMLKSLSRHITTKDGIKIPDIETTEQEDKPGDVFISYCWSNSYIAKQSNQITKFCGTKLSDPRYVKNKINTMGYSTWLDVERLKSADRNAGLFEQLALSLQKSKIFVPFISDEYANSVNCRMEFQFAIKSLQKPVVPIVVGHGNEWESTVIGLLLKSASIEPIVIQGIESEDQLGPHIDVIKERLSTLLGKGETLVQKELNESSSAPKPGDHVVSHHFNWTYYMATIVGYNISNMEYTVEWDDGDPSGRVQPYDQVALDVVPDYDVIGVGTIVFFPQGGYRATEGNNSGGIRYHEGIITNVTKEGDIYYFDGHHTRGVEDGKHLRYKAYDYTFSHVPLQEIRLAATAFDVVNR